MSAAWIKSKRCKALVVSDLHFGSPNSRRKKFLELLETWEFQILVLVGDIFDNLHLNRLHVEDRKCVRKIWKLREKGKQVVWLSGNHDHEFQTLFVDTHDNYMWNHDGLKYGALHGHQYDGFLSRYARFSEFVTSMYYWIQRSRLLPQRGIKWLKQTSKGRIKAIEHVRKGAVKFAEQHGLDFVFCGHTHHPEVKREKNVTYVNLGSFMEDPCTFAAVGLDGSVSLCEI